MYRLIWVIVGSFLAMFFLFLNEYKEKIKRDKGKKEELRKFIEDWLKSTIEEEKREIKL